jgi:four helix bundle protein
MVCFVAVGSFPSRDPAGLRRQLSEPANSVPANIAEGFGRGTRHEKQHRLRLARGSLEETQSHLKVSWKAGYLKSEVFYRLWNLTLVLSRMLAKLIAE